jgi:dGTPase
MPARLPSYREQAGLIVRDLYSWFFTAPDLMPAEWAEAAARAGAGEPRRARVVCDYIAGMTGRYAVAGHQRHFGDAPDLRLHLSEASMADAG